jgi:hypothetical protein
MKGARKFHATIEEHLETGFRSLAVSAPERENPQLRALRLKLCLPMMLRLLTYGKAVA